MLMFRALSLAPAASSADIANRVCAHGYDPRRRLEYMGEARIARDCVGGLTNASRGDARFTAIKSNAARRRSRR